MGMPKQQAGVSFSGFIVLTFLLIVVVLFGFKLVPAYIENAKIQHVFEEISHDAAMQGANAHDLLTSFDRRAAVEGIEAIRAADIVIEKGQDGRPVLSATYAVKIKVAGNVSVLIDFNPTSAGK